MLVFSCRLPLMLRLIVSPAASCWGDHFIDRKLSHEDASVCETDHWWGAETRECEQRTSMRGELSARLLVFKE